LVLYPTIYTSKRIYHDLLNVIMNYYSCQQIWDRFHHRTNSYTCRPCSCQS
jgi:hypothetical protein